MFYANFVLAKKGPLARVWLAAHWEKKLSKAHVFETDLQASVDNIISPKVKIALRTSGHLLLGVVRIYSRKAKYLLSDCTEALIKIKMAFRPDVVDLPLDNQKAAVSAITLPELQEWDAMVNNYNLGSFDINTFNNNVCRVEDITMKEDLVSTRLLTDDNFFGDTPFGEEISERDILRDEGSFHQLGDLSKTLVEEDEDTPTKETPAKEDRSLQLNQSNLDLAMNDPMMGGSGFGANEGLDFLEGFGMEDIREVSGVDIDADTGPKLDPLDTLDDTVISKDNLEIDNPITGISGISGIEDISAVTGAANQLDDESDYDEDSQPMDDSAKKKGRRKKENQKVTSTSRVDNTDEERLDLQDPPKTPKHVDENLEENLEEALDEFEPIAPPPLKDTEMLTTLFSEDTEVLNLEPIEEVIGRDKSRGRKRKRKLVVDQEKILRNEQIKQQINNDEDIIKTAVVAPPTKTRFVLLDSSSKTCFTQPAIIPSKKKRLNELYDLNLTLEKPEDFILPSSQDEELQLEQVSDVLQNIEEIPEILPEEITEEITNQINEEAEKEVIEEPLEEEEENPLDPLDPLAVEADDEMKEVEEELRNEEGINIAPAFELDTIVPMTTTDLLENIDDDGLHITYKDDETDDEEEDEDVHNIENNKRWTKRTHQTLRTLQKGLKRKQPIYFTDLTKKSNRKQAAYTFYTLLILSKEQAIEVNQSELFGDITVDRGAKFSAQV